MTKEEVVKRLESILSGLEKDLEWCSSGEIYALRTQVDLLADIIDLVKKIENKLPSYVQEALNSGDGTYRP